MRTLIWFLAAFTLGGLVLIGVRINECWDHTYAVTKPELLQSSLSTCSEQARNWISALVGFATVAALFVAYFQWRRAEEWKRHEYVAARAHEWEKFPGAHNAFLMLEWPARNIPLFDSNQPDVKWQAITHRLTAAALIPDSIRFATDYVESNVPATAAIRDCFEDLMLRVQSFQRMVDVGLVTEEQVDLQVANHLVRALQTTSEPKGLLVRNLRIYLHNRGVFEDATRLLARHDVQAPTAEERAALVREIHTGQWQTAFSALNSLMKPRTEPDSIN